MTAILLFCVLSISPQDCDEVSASHYERVPGEYALPFTCLREAQFWVGEHELVPAPGEYLKVRCSRSEFGGRVG